jgi:hypothetical protein
MVNRPEVPGDAAECASHVGLSTCRPASRSQVQMLGMDHGIPPFLPTTHHLPFTLPADPAPIHARTSRNLQLQGSPSSSIAGLSLPVRCCLGSLMTSEPHSWLAFYDPAEYECRCGPPLLACLKQFTGPLPQLPRIIYERLPPCWKWLILSLCVLSISFT